MKTHATDRFPAGLFRVHCAALETGTQPELAGESASASIDSPARGASLVIRPASFSTMSNSSVPVSRGDA
jgi:hypothetical protein